MRSEALIGISLAYEDIGNPNKNRFHVQTSYVEALTKCGAIPILIPIMPEKFLREIMGQLDGLLLTGGGGLLPHIQKLDKLPGLRQQNPVRHEFDLLLVKLARENNIPMMGICRGHQVLNEYFGGSLYENLSELTEEKHLQTEPGDQPTHSISIEEHSILFSSLQEREVKVNSFHQQAIKQAGQGLRVTARSLEGIVEAIEGTEDQFILGLQFHPEQQMKAEPRFAALFERFVLAARERQHQQKK